MTGTVRSNRKYLPAGVKKKLPKGETVAFKREHQVPEIVRDYNLFMDGVDLSDMCIYMCLDERRTIRWNKKVFFTL